MKIKYHVHIQGALQRSLVEHGQVVFRRIARTLDTCDGSIRELPDSHWPAIWQEQQPNKEFHVVSPSHAAQLELAFVETLIADLRQGVNEVLESTRQPANT